MIKTVLAGLALAIAFAAGWFVADAIRDRTELTREVNAQTAARLIEQGRSIARDEAVKDANNRLALAGAGVAALRDTVNELREKSNQLAASLDARQCAAGATAATGSKATETGAGMLADMLGRVAEEAKNYARIADERYSAGIACEDIYKSVE